MKERRQGPLAIKKKRKDESQMKTCLASIEEEKTQTAGLYTQLQFYIIVLASCALKQLCPKMQY